MKIRIKSIGCFLSLAAISSLSSIALASVASTGQQYGSYVILGQSPAGDNVAIARTVIDTNLTCPTVSAQGDTATTSMITRENPNNFSVLVCEALIGFDQTYQINFSDQSITLPMAKSNPVNIQVFGDSGCKEKDCAIGTPAEPFKSLADAGAAEKPDLVLHMGDFNYRGTSGKTYFSQRNASGQIEQSLQWPYDAGDGLSQADHCGQDPGTPYYSQSATNSNRPDIWRNWNDDLFMSGQNLMAAAPWITARGNHELCSRAGPGYFYFMDANTNLTDGGQQLSCPLPDINKSALQNTVQTPSYKVSFNNLDIVVVDSANACDSYADSPFEAVYRKTFAEVTDLVSGSGASSSGLTSTSTPNKNTWLVTHRPIWGVEPYETGSTACSADNQYACINQMMQQAIAAQPAKALPENIELVISGHMHKFESVSFSDEDRPANLIVGPSGVSLASGQPYGKAKVEVDGLNAQIVSTSNQIQFEGDSYSAFGFLTMQLASDGSNWQAQLVNPPKNLVLAQCASESVSGVGICQLASGISVTNQ